MHPVIKLRLFLLLYIFFVIAISLMPGGDLPIPVRHADKAGHFFTYGVMAVLALLSFRGAVLRFFALFAAVGLGALLEWGQSFVPGRERSLADGLVNALGVLAGAALFRWQGGTLQKWVQFLLRLPQSLS